MFLKTHLKGVPWQIMICSDRLDYNYSCVYVSKNAFFFCSAAIVDFVNCEQYIHHCLRSHKLHFSVTFLLKIGPTVLFTHLKIISLQCFQFQFSVSAKINSIQTHPYYSCSNHFNMLWNFYLKNHVNVKLSESLIAL